MKLWRFKIGFSIVELAVVLAILGLVFVGFTSGIGSFYHSANIEDSERIQLNIKKQLLNFVVVNKYLPCPDTDADGQENRSGTRCTAEVGGVPYINLGLKEEEVEDSWGNAIRYAVNTDADDAGLICNKTSSASMFCNAGIGRSVSATGITGNIPWFTLTDTPPFAANRGAGNYFVCNEIATSANCAGTPTDANLISDSAVAVLVSYNEDGAATLANCGATAGATNENCDLDNLYHQQTLSYADGARFDDLVTHLSGQEVKALTLSPIVAWSSFDAVPGSTPLTPTFETFDLATDSDVAAAGTSGDDVVLVNRNVSKAVNYGDGDDYIAIGNDLQASADMSTGAGNDTVYIVGAALSDINLGAGDDVFVLGTDLVTELKAKGGDDRVWIMGDVKSTASLLLGGDDDVLWLGNSDTPGTGDIESLINGQAGYDILVLENVANWSDFNASGQNSEVKNFELVIFSEDGAGNREYVVCNNDGANRCTNYVP